MRKSSRVFAVVLAVTLMLPLAACKKKKKDLLSIKKQKYVSGQEIKETDPYFNAEISQIQLPIDEDKKLENAFIEDWTYAGGAVIVSTSKYKDLAWNLIRAYLEYDPETPTAGVLPVNRETFGKKMVADMKDMQDTYDKVMESLENGGEFYGTLPLATQEDIDEIRRQITIASDVYCYDKAMLDVILEESAGYFAGDRTEEDVLKTIQNRTSIIVKEK